MNLDFIPLLLAFGFGVLITIGSVIVVRVPLPPRVTRNPFLQGGAAAQARSARLAHNQKVGGSNPSPATSFGSITAGRSSRMRLIRCPDSTCGERRKCYAAASISSFNPQLRRALLRRILTALEQTGQRRP